MMGTAYLFPGQGSQYVGMGRDLYESFASAKAIFQEADEVLGMALSRLCFEGPEDELRKTINAQPALVTVSYVCLTIAREVCGEVLPTPDYVAGHSLGEYTALAAAGMLDFPGTLRLARERGRLMYEAGKLREGGMAAIIGLDEARLADACREGGSWIANINCPGQLVISGAKEDVDRTVELAKAGGAGRAIPLPVSGAFHTPLMQPAAEGMARYLAGLNLREPGVPIVANTTAQPLMDTGAVKAELFRQLCSCVQWQKSIEFMLAHSITTFIEIGPGKVLTGLTRRISKDAKTVSLGDLGSIRGLLAAGKAAS